MLTEWLATVKRGTQCENAQKSAPHPDNDLTVLVRNVNKRMDNNCHMCGDRYLSADIQRIHAVCVCGRIVCRILTCVRTQSGLPSGDACHGGSQPDVNK